MFVSMVFQSMVEFMNAVFHGLPTYWILEDGAESSGRNTFAVMTSNVTKTPLLLALSKRSYAAQVAAKPGSSSRPSTDVRVQTTVLPNKLVVTSLDTQTPISRVSVLFRAGSRYETEDNLGVSHVLRIAAGLGTKDSTAFGITRNIQQIGGNLSITTDREAVAYTLETTKDHLETGLKYLGDVACKQVFKPWELSDNIPRLKYELASLPPQVRLLDLLNKAAYRTELGNSLYCPDYKVGKHGSETMQHYVRSLFTTNRTTVAGVGVDHGELVAYAHNLSLESGAGPSLAAKYAGGEIRHDTASEIAHVAVAVEGASLANEKEALAFAILQHALGVGPCTKWGSAAGSLLAKAVAKSAGENPFAVSAINVSYSDSGLLGVLVSCPGSAAKAIVEQAVKQLRSGSVSEADIARGKAQLKAAILFCSESGSGLVEEIGTQALLLGKVHTGLELAAAVDSVTSVDINAAAKKVASGKLSLSAVGKLGKVPYLDQL